MPDTTPEVNVAGMSSTDAPVQVTSTGSGQTGSGYTLSPLPIGGRRRKSKKGARRSRRRGGADEEVAAAAPVEGARRRKSKKAGRRTRRR